MAKGLLLPSRCDLNPVVKTCDDRKMGISAGMTGILVSWASAGEHLQSRGPAEGKASTSFYDPSTVYRVDSCFSFILCITLGAWLES